MKKLESLDSDLFKPLSLEESKSLIGGQRTAYATQTLNPNYTDADAGIDWTW